MPWVTTIPWVPMGPNAVGTWQGASTQGSYSGFNIPDQAWIPTMVRVTLVGYVTGRLPADHRVGVTLMTPGGNPGPPNYGHPLELGAASLNEHVGAAAAGTWVVDFSLYYALPAGSMQGQVDVNIKLLRQAPSAGYELHLDAIGVEVRMEDPNEVFDLWLGNDAAALDGSAPYLPGIARTVDLGAADCPWDICFVRVRDGAGAGRILSVLLLPDGDTFRIGFKDGREDAPVDAALSLVVAPATAPADGVSLVRVTVTPYDAGGLPLGEGVSLRLDPASLGPAEVVGGFTHQGDGSFVILLRAARPGDAMLVVQADGVTLNQSPVVSFVAP